MLSSFDVEQAELIIQRAQHENINQRAIDNARVVLAEIASRMRAFAAHNRQSDVASICNRMADHYDRLRGE
jgi:hypothetical protein